MANSHTTAMSGRRTIAAVPCPHCGYGYSRAIYGQSVDGVYRRRRVCADQTCAHGFITYEVAARNSKEPK